MTANALSPTPSAPIGGADLLHSLELFVDGPVLWGRPIPANKPGIFVVELPAPQPTVAIDAGAIRGWLERVPDLRLDGHHPTVAELQAKLAGFWLPGQVILYVGSSAKSVASRLSAMYRTQLGDRRPNHAGYWLKTLHDLPKARIWWAETDDPELYEDAALDAFRNATGTLPFAVLATPSGVRKEHGLLAPLRDNEDVPPATPRNAVEARSQELARSRASRLGVTMRALTGSEPDEAAARKAAAKAPPKATPKPATAAAPAAPGRSTRPAPARPTAAQAPSALTPQERTRIPRSTAKAATAPPTEPAAYLSAGGLEQLKEELDRLVTHDRPEVIARIKAARELGDLSENADYEAARKEQSFLEGRVQQLEQLIKQAVVIDESQIGHEVTLGSTVTVETAAHGQETFTIVGSIEADAAAGKISYTSPIGKALMGKRAGETVRIQVPAGAIEYAIVEVR